MRIKRKLLAMLCLTLCFSLVFSSSVYGAPTAKQIIIEKINEADLTTVYDQIYEASSGTFNMRLNELSGEAISFMGDLQGLNGTDLFLGYKLNSDKKQLELNYDLNLMQETYKGDMYLTDKEYILTAEGVMNIVRALSPNPESINESNLLLFMKDTPQYFYVPLGEADILWNTFNQPSVPKEVKDYLIFLVEAIPDKYISFSISDQSIVFTLDSAGLADVVHSVTEKAVNEPNRFAEIIAGIVANGASSDAPALKTEIKSSILYILQDMQDSGIPSAAEMQREIESVFVLKSFRLQKSLISKDINYTMTGVFAKELGITGDVRADYHSSGSEDNYNGAANFSVKANVAPEGSGNLSYEMEFQGIKDEISGDYNMNLTLQGGELEGELNAEFIMSGKYDYSLTHVYSQDEIKIDINMYGDKLLGLSLESDAAAIYDPEVVIEIPKLTPTNSMDMSNIGNNDTLKLFINGNPVTTYDNWFGAKLVPVREVAGLFGCQVEWIEPDEIVVTRDDVIMDMQLDMWVYTINGEEIFNEPPTLIDGVTVVPIWVFTEAFDCQATYNGRNNSVNIRTN